MSNHSILKKKDRMFIQYAQTFFFFLTIPSQSKWLRGRGFTLLGIIMLKLKIKIPIIILGGTILILYIYPLIRQHKISVLHCPLILSLYTHSKYIGLDNHFIWEKIAMTLSTLELFSHALNLLIFLWSHCQMTSPSCFQISFDEDAQHQVHILVNNFKTPKRNNILKVFDIFNLKNFLI